MLTPADIHNKDFKRGFRGYDEDDVDSFLDEIIHDFEILEHENTRLKEELVLEKKKLEQLQQMEKNLQDTLLVAQKTADEVIRNAKQRAEEIRRTTDEECVRLRRQTEMDLAQHLEDMRSQVRGEEEKYDAIRQSQRQFLIKIKALLRTELDLLDEEGVRQAVGALDDSPAPDDKPQEDKVSVTEDTLIMTPRSLMRHSQDGSARDALQRRDPGLDEAAASLAE